MYFLLHCTIQTYIEIGMQIALLWNKIQKPDYFWSILKKIKTTKLIIWLVGILLAVHLIASVTIYFFQDNIIFQRKALSKDYLLTFHRDSSQSKIEEYFIKTEDGDSLNALLFKTKIKIQRVYPIKIKTNLQWLLYRDIR